MLNEGQCSLGVVLTYTPSCPLRNHPHRYLHSIVTPSNSLFLLTLIWRESCMASLDWWFLPWAGLCPMPLGGPRAAPETGLLGGFGLSCCRFVWAAQQPRKINVSCGLGCGRTPLGPESLACSVNDKVRIRTCEHGAPTPLASPFLVWRPVLCYCPHSRSDGVQDGEGFLWIFLEPFNPILWVLSLAIKS